MPPPSQRSYQNQRVGSAHTPAVCYQTLEANTEILYLVTKEFSLPHDDGINPTDPVIDIAWPLEVKFRSKKDTERKFLSERDFIGIDIA